MLGEDAVEDAVEDAGATENAGDLPSGESGDPQTPETSAVGAAGVGAQLPDGFEDAVLAEIAAVYPEETAALQQSWGKDAGQNTLYARRALEQIEASAPGFVAEISDRMTVATPKILSALALLGRRLAATPGDPNSVSLDHAIAEAAADSAAVKGRPAQELQAEIDGITRQAWEDGAYYSSAVQEKLRPLYQQLHGTAETSGR